MAFCPNCRAPYQADRGRCAACDVELVAALPQEPWKQVFRGSFAHAAVVRAALESAGIATLEPDELIASQAAFYSSTGFFSGVLVHASDERRALDVIRGLDRIETQTPGPDDPAIS